MDAPLALVIAVDGLRAAALGAYGNTWSPTRACDELASRSIVYEWMFAAGPDVQQFYADAWSELPAAVTTLLTDDPDVAEQADSAGISDVQLAQIDEDTRSPAADVAETASARLFALAAEQLENQARSARPSLLWLHARGLHGPWDAPLELREALVDADDPPAPTFVHPPARVATEDHDELFRYRVAYAAQVTAIDQCLGMLLAAAEELSLLDRLLIVFVGCRGFALGEHGGVGVEVHSLYGEFIHTPCFISTPTLPPAPLRRAQFMRPADLTDVFQAWFTTQEVDLPADGPCDPVRIIADDGEAVVRTSEWMLRRGPGNSASADFGVELYVKPDDRWELNDVASRCPDVVEDLSGQP